MHFPVSVHSLNAKRIALLACLIISEIPFCGLPIVTFRVIWKLNRLHVASSWKYKHCCYQGPAPGIPIFWPQLCPGHGSVSEKPRLIPSGLTHSHCLLLTSPLFFLWCQIEQFEDSKGHMVSVTFNGSNQQTNHHLMDFICGQSNTILTTCFI